MTCKIITTLCFTFLYVFLCVAENDQHKIIEIKQGRVKGYSSDDVYAFYGIPYATAPKGNSKFKDPLPAPKWTDTFEATSNRIACPQPTTPKEANFLAGYNLNITEDCLIANVFSPKVGGKNLPVVASIHGGAYSVSFGNRHTPFNVVKEGNIIFVSANYRLSIDGFLCLGTENVPGNAGVKDAIAFLKWVKENIAQFGGNPNDVTLTGFSAGAALVSILMTTEAADGLYNKIIIESGSGLSNWGIAQDPIELATAFGKTEGLTDVNNLEDFYLNLDRSKVRVDNTGREDGALFFVPCVEQNKPGAVVTVAPYVAVTSGIVKKVPVLISIDEMEGLLRKSVFDKWSKKMNEDFAQFLPSDLSFDSADEKRAVVQKVKEFYFGKAAVDASTVQEFIDFFTDSTFSYPIQKTARELAKSGNKDVYLYYYVYHEPSTRGANHCDQTAVIYDQRPFSANETDISQTRKQVKKNIREFWLNFVKNGKPSASSTQDKEDWTPLSDAQYPYMEVSSHLKIKNDLLKERFEFWDGIYENHRRSPVPPPPHTGTTPL